MKASLFNIFVDSNQNCETVLYNTLYGSMALFDENEISRVKEILASPQDKLNHELYSVLIDQKYMVPDDVDEIAIVEQRKIAGIRDENRLDLIIMPTLECNFACVYCYEDRRPGKMTKSFEKSLSKWLENEIPKFKIVMLHWFGGEPLLDYEHVLSISRHVKDISVSDKNKCVVHITTNGYLLNKERSADLVEAGILDYQITVDGPPETHDELRVLRNGKGTFDKLFSNIIDLARIDERVKISMRINFNHKNLHKIPKLLEMFPKDVRPHLRVVYEPIFGNCALSATENLVPDEISEAMTEYYELARQLGYDVVLSGGGIQPGKLVYCYAERENQFIVNYNGDVFKCSVGKFTPDTRAGHINSDGKFIKEQAVWEQWVREPLFEKECYSCTYLPLCMGGCRKARLENEGTGSYCTLVPTNASYILKQIALGNFEDMVRGEGTMA